LLEQAIQHAEAMEGSSTQSVWVTALSEAYLLAGRVDEALTSARRALALADSRRRSHQAWLLRLLGEITAHHHPPEAAPAEDYYRQALTLAEELGMRPLQAHCHSGLGTLYRHTGQPEQARVELSTAIEMYRDMEMAFWLPETEAALAAVECG
jgi:tetratricopeptide (TPR) repeat protein